MRLEELAGDPFAVIVLMEAKIISSWFSFLLRVARVLDSTVSSAACEDPPPPPHPCLHPHSSY